ncbi:MAG: uroporphyrinogen-III C-methyltransferase [Pseudomonadales bacterium]
MADKDSERAEDKHSDDAEIEDATRAQDLEPDEVATESETSEATDTASGDTPASDADQDLSASDVDEAEALSGAAEVEAETAASESAGELENETPPAPVKQVKSGRGLAWLALLLALIAAGGIGYLYYQLIYLDPVANLKQDIQNTAAEGGSEVADLRAALRQQQTNIEQQLAEARSQQAAELAQTQSAVLESLQQALLAAPPSQREWKLAEAEYLLRIGNHRVLMEGDTEGALSLFQAVDQILAELDDFALHQVRAVLADEILALRQVRRSDSQGIYLRLEAIKSNLDEVVFKTPEYVTEQAPVAEDETVWAQLYAQLKEFVRVRPVGGDETIAPLLSPAEEHYLELNLRLALEQAQLAALKGQQFVFVSALQNVRDWLAAYTEDPGDILQTEVGQLMLLDLERPLPDVSTSLIELQKVRRGGE